MLVLLDRDGVINKDLPQGVLLPEQFEMFPFVPSALSMLKQAGFKLAIVTNQSAIGTGLLTEQTLEYIHSQLQDKLLASGALIDRFYFCPDRPDKPTHRRKPNPGMAFQAKNDFPDVDFSKSVMVGNSMSDMEFGRNAGMKTVYIS